MFLTILAVAAAIAATIAFIFWLADIGHGYIALMVTTLAIAVGVYASWYVTERSGRQAQEQCEASGGEYIAVGSHLVATSKGAIRVTDYECGQRVPG